MQSTTDQQGDHRSQIHKVSTQKPNTKKKTKNLIPTMAINVALCL